MTGREALVAEALRRLGQRERLIDGQPTNRSVQIDYMNAALGVPLGSPYCCSAVTQEGIEAVGRSHWPFLATASVQELVSDCERRGLFTRDPSRVQPGDLVVFFFDSLGRWGHIGVVEAVGNGHCTSLDGNTTPDAPPGSPTDRDGSGWFRKTRPVGPHVGFCLWPGDAG